MGKIDELSSKERILKASEKIFSEKGFDGARVDEIAKEAGVNKALIYYYFESKEEILQQLFRTFSEEWIKETGSVFTGLVSSDASMDEILESPEKAKELVRAVFGFWEQRRDILRVVLMESLKKREGEPYIIGMVNVFITDEVEALIRQAKALGLKMDMDRIQMIVTEFFTSSMPFIGFFVFSEALGKKLGIGGEELKTRFIKAWLGTHGAYHRNLQVKEPSPA